MRALSAGMQAAVVAARVRPLFFYEGVFTSGTTRAWTGTHELLWNGQTWMGAGLVGGISAIQENGELQAASVTVELRSTPATKAALALSQSQQGAAGLIWVGALDDNNRIIADPYHAFRGRLDVPEIDLDGDNSVVRITYVNELVDLLSARERRYTDADQRLDYPEDGFFKHVAALQDANLKWGPG